MPHIAIIYIKCGKNLPDETIIRFDFPGNHRVEYVARNIFLQKLSKEYITENRLYQYIPFYIARYETSLKQQQIPIEAVNDLEYFRDHIESDLSKGLINQGEAMILAGFVNMIIKHITDGNEIDILIQQIYNHIKLPIVEVTMRIQKIPIAKFNFSCYTLYINKQNGASDNKNCLSMTGI